MASGFFAVLDDIAALMDDVALASKVATQKTAGILGDDLAVNAEKATGFNSSREIPVLLKITKGSLINKVIIIPIALLLNYFFPIAIEYILIAGGCYLAYEGAEKIIHYFAHYSKSKDETHELASNASEQTEENEAAKVKAAITTDFILSIEIVIIALGSVLNETLPIQILTVCIVSLLATVGVYGIVTLIVRMDDAGYKLMRKTKSGSGVYLFGKGLVRALPIVIKALAIIGTLALLLVSGGIFAHHVGFMHSILESWPGMLREFTFGLIVGLIVFLLISGVSLLVKTAKK